MSGKPETTGLVHEVWEVHGVKLSYNFQYKFYSNKFGFL